MSAGYFHALRIAILKGRPLGTEDVPESEAVVVVNQALADRYFPGRDAVGRKLRLGTAESWRTIVGVAANVVNAQPGEPVMPQAYVSFEQQPGRTLTFLVRTSSLEAATAAARGAVAELDPLQPLYDVKTMDRAFFEDMASNRVITGLFIAFAAVALGIAGVGLYGLISYSVSQRTREIGVRIALGARRSDILRLVLGQGVRLTMSGLVVGLFLGLALSRVMAGVLVGVSATDRLTFTVVPVVLAAVALVACAIPARRAARCDPATVLKSE